MNASVVPDSAGFQAELLRIASAQLYLVDGEESLLMKHGDFSVRLSKQTDSPLAVVLASVGDVHWPLGKDSPTLRMRSRNFAFVLTGLIYGLVLPDSTPAQAVAQLEDLLMQYCTFEVRQERVQLGGATPFEHEKPALSFWTALAPEILRSSVKLLGAMCDAGSSALASTILKRRRVSVSAMSEVKGNSSDSGGLDPTPRSMKRVQQARRISAVSKLLSRTLLRGALSASNHVADMCATQMGSPTNARASMDRVAVASVDAISKIVEAVESAGKSILTSDTVRKFASSSTNDLNQADDYQEDSAKRKGSRFGSPNSSWTLNRTGLALLFRVTAASAKLYSSCRSPNPQASSMQDYMNFSGGRENNSDVFDAKSSLSHGNMTHSDQMRCSPSEGHSPMSSSEEVPSSLPELSLFPSRAFNSSLAGHEAAQQFFTADAKSPQVLFAQPQQQTAAVPAMSNICFSPFSPTNTYSSNRTFGQNFGGGALDRQQPYHPK